MLEPIERHSKDIFVSSPDRQDIVRVDADDIDNREARANAALIAAAPDLLEACQQAVFAIPTTHGAFETVKNAIKKALTIPKK